MTTTATHADVIRHITETPSIHRTHSSHEPRGTYMGHPIIKATSWITTSEWFTDNNLRADTIRGLKNAIRAQHGLDRLYW